jgi:AraC family transcriptional regulator of adaptative response / DNA-3-methyladenine glycosylase II
MDLDPDICFRALRSRDARFDGRFFTAVRTTGIYCRPICPARAAKRENLVFFAHAAAAEDAGFRPCLRCRPDAAPSTPTWGGTRAVVSRALRLIAEGALDGGDVDDLGARVGLGARHLRRLFLRHLGATPVAVAQTRRLHLARTLIHTTPLPLSDIAFGSGFSSLRRFNAAFRAAYGIPPTSLRKRGPRAAASAQIELRLNYRPPYDWPGILDFLRARAIAGVERVTDQEYARTVGIENESGIIRVRHAPRGEHLVLSIPLSLSTSIHRIAERVARMFDVGADPDIIASQLSRDRQLGAVVRRHPGVRVPGCWDRFELAVRAIVGQQITVAGATKILGRIARTYGSSLEGGDPDLDTRFPTAEILAQVDLSGMPAARARTLRELARSVAGGSNCLDTGASLETSIARLVAIPGIGPWTAHYIAMRALGEPDAFPTGDVALRRAAGHGSPLTEAALLRRAERWRPWRAYAAIYLWRSLGDPKELR